jgi:electron transfer flavoprotein alpha subunit
MRYVIYSEAVQPCLELIACAKAHNADEIIAVTTDYQVAQVCSKRGCTKVIYVELPEGALLEDAAAAVTGQARLASTACVLVGATRRGTALAARVAQHLGTAAISNVREIGSETVKHFLYGGKLIVTMSVKGPYRVVLVPAALYESAQESTVCAIEKQTIDATSGALVLARKPKTAGTVDLTSAKSIVCIGRGVTTQEQFELCGKLADSCGAELGCTRPVTETEKPLMPRDTYIGSSGVTVKPDLFIAVAASGQTQHTMGMYESKKVVVIDKNPNALFFRQCDYGVVAELEEVLPAITMAIRA